MLTDSAGRRVSFKNAIVVMTSNVGGEIRSDGLGFSPAGREGMTQDSLRQYFTPEFLGRLDRIICFRKLDAPALERIAEKYLNAFRQRAAESGVQLRLPEELPAWLAGRCQAKDGARQLRRLVQEQVEGPLALHLLQTGKKTARIRGYLEEDGLRFQG